MPRHPSNGRHMSPSTSYRCGSGSLATSSAATFADATPGTLTDSHSERPRKDHRSQRPPRRQQSLITPLCARISHGAYQVRQLRSRLPQYTCKRSAGEALALSPSCNSFSSLAVSPSRSSMKHKPCIRPVRQRHVEVVIMPPTWLASRQGILRRSLESVEDLIPWSRVPEQ